ncbi:carboxymuconolactone decarboxylase family protein [Nocardia sp. NPDC051030]|uniref:carboxymuconolactone decarboxylase family protein n=1 Tax=Nocardia sp. NPDC051030 TaxID=3155162 RepID=UPI0034128C35
MTDGIDVRTTRGWRGPVKPRTSLELRRIGPLAWAASRLAGAATGSGRVHAIEAVGLVPGMLPFFGLYFGYVNSLTRLKRADSELVILRTAWNCGSYYEWYQHVHTSKLAGLTVAEVERVGAGPDAPGWSDKQRAVLRAVDELCADRLIGDDAWAAMREFFDDRQTVALCLLTGNYAMLAMLINSFGLQPEAGMWQAWPLRALVGRDEDLTAVLARPAGESDASRSNPVPEWQDSDNVAAIGDRIDLLAAAPHFRSADPKRIALGTFRDVGPLTWVLSRLGGIGNGGGEVTAADAIGMDPRMMRHYLPFALKLVLGSHLSRRDTELATLRLTWNSGVRYEWFYHAHFSRISGVSVRTVERVAVGPDAPGWSARERLLLSAVDELQTDRCLSEDTWSRLRTHYTERKLAALCLLVGHYDMIGMLFRSFGVEPEPGALQSGLGHWAIAKAAQLWGI